MSRRSKQERKYGISRKYITYKEDRNITVMDSNTYSEYLKTLNICSLNFTKKEVYEKSLEYFLKSYVEPNCNFECDYNEFRKIVATNWIRHAFTRYAEYIYKMRTDKYIKLLKPTTNEKIYTAFPFLRPLSKEKLENLRKFKKSA